MQIWNASRIRRCSEYYPSCLVGTLKTTDAATSATTPLIPNAPPSTPQPAGSRAPSLHPQPLRAKHNERGDDNLPALRCLPSVTRTQVVERLRPMISKL